MKDCEGFFDLCLHIQFNPGFHSRRYLSKRQMKMENTFACHITRPWFVMPQQLSNSGNCLNLPVLRRWKSSAAWGRMECSCLNSEQMKRNEPNMNVLWRLDLDREALPDVLRTVIEGKRMLALQLDQVGR